MGLESTMYRRSKIATVANFPRSLRGIVEPPELSRPLMPGFPRAWTDRIWLPKVIVIWE
jgi:hypothetical protein